VPNRLIIIIVYNSPPAVGKRHHAFNQLNQPGSAGGSDMVLVGTLKLLLRDMMSSMDKPDFVTSFGFFGSVGRDLPESSTLSSVIK
jgi:hypothetical protein